MTWLTGWNYRKAITVSNSGSSLTDYQISIIIDTVSLVSAGKLLSSCNDIRFTSSDGSTLLNYWIEYGCNTSSTKIWIKIPSIANGTNIVYLYYNNPYATSLSNGTNAFILFDDFATGSSEIWTKIDAGNRFSIDRTTNHRIDISGMPDTAANERIVIDKGTDIGNFAYDFTFSRTDASNGTGFKIGVSDTNNNPLATTWVGGVYFAAHQNNSAVKNWGVATRIANAGGTADWISYAYGTSTVYYATLTRLGNVFGVKVYSDSARTTLVDRAYSTTQSGISELRYIYAITNYGDTSHGASGWVKDIHIRNYASLEPTVCFGGEEVSTPSWLTNWSRRKLLTITGSTAGIQTDYQMKLIVHKASDTDTSTDIYVGNHVKNDFSDLRFTTSDGSTLLNYWIESYTSGSIATVWIQIPSIPASPCTTTMYAYYDNSGASTLSSGTNTFIEFLSFESGLESFSGGSRNTDKAYDGSYSFQGAIGYYARRANITITRPFIKEYSYYVPSGQSGDFVDINVCVPTDNRAAGINFGYPTSEKWGYVNNSLAWTNSGVGITYDTWHTLKFIVGISSIDIYTDNTIIFAGSTLISASPYAGNDNIYLYSGKTFYIDAIRSRKYVSPEPTFSTIGSEEIFALPANITATSLIITPSATPCIAGSCTVTVDVIWTNTGGTSGSFTPSIKIDNVPVITDPVLTPVSVGPSLTASQQFVVSGLSTGIHNICPDPN